MGKQMLASAFVLLASALSLSAKEHNQKSSIGPASASPQLQPVASLTLSESPQSGQAEVAWVSVAFTSETSIAVGDRKSTRLNSSHQIISYAVFCLKKKKKNNNILGSTSTARLETGLLHTSGCRDA